MGFAADFKLWLLALEKENEIYQSRTNCIKTILKIHLQSRVVSPVERLFHLVALWYSFKNYIVFGITYFKEAYDILITYSNVLHGHRKYEKMPEKNVIKHVQKLAFWKVEGDT